MRGNGPPVERGDFHGFLQKNTPALKLKLMRSVNSLTDALGLSLVPVMFIVCPLALAVVFHLVRGMYRMPNAFWARARARASKCKGQELTEEITAAQSGPENPFAGKRVFRAFGNCFWIRGRT